MFFRATVLAGFAGFSTSSNHWSLTAPAGTHAETTFALGTVQAVTLQAPVFEGQLARLSVKRIAYTDFICRARLVTFIQLLDTDSFAEGHAIVSGDARVSGFAVRSRPTWSAREVSQCKKCEQSGHTHHHQRGSVCLIGLFIFIPRFS